VPRTNRLGDRGRRLCPGDARIRLQSRAHRPAMHCAGTGLA
jgi:hypothetical protein